jgi:trehalose 6-phosphate phosphatase
MADEAGRRRRAGAATRRAGAKIPPPPLGPDCALFLDIDGTLVELAPAPDRVRVDPRMSTLLPAITERLGGAVALITGRALEDADRLFPGLALPIAGQHGMERRAADRTIHVHEASTSALRSLRAALTRFVARHEGLLLEDKGATLAVHYRLAPGLASHVHRTLKTWLASSDATKGLRLQPGKRVLEIKPDGRDKGTAVREYLQERPFAGRVPVYVGDDHTDEYGFAAAAAAGGWSVKVGPGRTHARFRLPDVASVGDWLRAALPAAPAASCGGKADRRVSRGERDRPRARPRSRR